MQAFCNTRSHFHMEDCFDMKVKQEVERWSNICNQNDKYLQS